MLLPSGVKFCPTDQELINDFLKKAVAGEGLAPPLDSLVLTYSDNVLATIPPWVLWDGFEFHHLTEQQLYFLTKLKSTSAKSAKVSQKMESGGTWSGSHSVDVKDDDGNCVGLKRYLRYEKKRCDHNGKWLLEEYSIPQAPMTVLCRLKKGPTRTSGGLGTKRKTSACGSEETFDMPSHKKARQEAPETPPQQTSSENLINNDSMPVMVDDQEDHMIANMGEFLGPGEMMSLPELPSSSSFPASTSTSFVGYGCITPPESSPESSSDNLMTSSSSPVMIDDHKNILNHMDHFLETGGELGSSEVCSLYYPAIGGSVEGEFETLTSISLDAYSLESIEKWLFIDEWSH